jgi:hypothetical protein
MQIGIRVLLLCAFLVSGCTSSNRSGSTHPVPGGPDVVVIGGDQTVRDAERVDAVGGRSVRVPPGHYPPPGACRVWHVGRPPGHQPPPTACERLVGRVPPGAFVIYNGRAWDTRYDWGAHERRNRGSVPDVILSLMRSVPQ